MTLDCDIALVLDRKITGRELEISLRSLLVPCERGINITWTRVMCVGLDYVIRHQ